MIETLGDIGDKACHWAHNHRHEAIFRTWLGRSLGWTDITDIYDIGGNALGKLTGQDFGSDTKKWEDWWAENKPKEQAPKTLAPRRKKRPKAPR